MKTITKKELMYQRIEQHGKQLNAIFDTGMEPIALCKKLKRLETKAHKLATDYCNGENGVNTDNWDAMCQPIITQVERLLFPHGRERHIPIFINRDARGYALKINDKAVSYFKLNIHKDMGGYGILAPCFTEV